MSCTLVRARPQITGPCTSRAIASTASKSPGLVIGKPASITSTPRRASWRAISSFSLLFSEMPGDCSPSRSVVSKILTRFASSLLLMPFPFSARPALLLCLRLRRPPRAISSPRGGGGEAEVELELHRFERTATSVDGRGVRRLLLLIRRWHAWSRPRRGGRAPTRRRPGKVFHSGIGGYGPGAVDAFAGAVGQAPGGLPVLRLVEVGPAGPELHGAADAATTERGRVAHDVRTCPPRAPALTPAAIARGDGDGFLAGDEPDARRARPALLPAAAVGDEQRRQPVRGVRPARALARARLLDAGVQAGVAPGRAGDPRRRGGAIEQQAGEDGDARRCGPALRSLPTAAGGLPVGAAVVRQPRDRAQPPAPLVAGVALRGLGGHHLVLAVPGGEGDRPLLPLPRSGAASRSPSASTASGAPRARASSTCSSASCAPTGACS